MKSPQLFLLLLFITLAPAAAIGQTVNPRDWSPTWINPSWERPANMVADGPISLPGDLTVDQLESSTICGGCHNAILEQWKGSMHANALIDPVFQAASTLFLSEVTAAGDREEALSCVRCHTPFGHLSKTAETTAADYAAATEALGTRSGIFCDFCHSVESSAGVGNAPFLVDAGQGDAQKIKQGPRTDAVSPYHETAFSDLHTKSEFCGMCHDVTHTLTECLSKEPTPNGGKARTTPVTPPPRSTARTVICGSAPASRQPVQPTGLTIRVYRQWAAKSATMCLPTISSAPTPPYPHCSAGRITPPLPVITSKIAQP